MWSSSRSVFSQAVRSTWRRYRRGGVDIWVDDVSDESVRFVIGKEGFPVVKRLEEVSATVTIDDLNHE